MEEHPVYGLVYHVRELLDGRDLMVVPLTFGNCRLLIGERDAPTYDDAW